MLGEKEQVTITRQTEETLRYLRELRDILLKATLVSARQLVDRFEAETILANASADEHRMQEKRPHLFATDSPELWELMNDIDRYITVMGVTEVENYNQDGELLDEPVEQTIGWTFGNIEVYSGTIPILRGELDRFRRVPISRPLAERAVAYLLDIPGIAEKLKRETHGWGWHYHYCRKSNERSDTVLSFDTRTSDVPRPLFWERHAVTDADFEARPGLWNDEKRLSVYSVCARDLNKWEIHEFKHASKEASSVWPREAVLAQPQKSAGKSTKKRSRK